MANPTSYAKHRTIDMRGLALDVSQIKVDGVPQLGTTQAALIADAKVDYADDGSANDLDTDAKRVAAANAANAKINSILDILEANGLMAAS